MPPHSACEKSPAKILPPGDGQSVEAMSPDNERIDIWARGLDLDDLRPVVDASDRWQSEPIDDYDACSGQPHHQPERFGEQITRELGAVKYLMRYGKCQR